MKKMYLCALALCLAPAAALAADATLPEVVVTATRHAEEASGVVANVTVISQEQIAQSKATSVPEILRLQAGVQVNDIGGSGRNITVDLRGFGETAALNTLVLVDGRRINQFDLSGTDWMLIPVERIERIEIIRGGRASVLYGDNAAGGVVNIITRQGGETAAELTVAGGSYDTLRSGAVLQTGNDKLAVNLSGTYSYTDGYRDNSDNIYRDGGASLSYYATDRLALTLSGGWHDDSASLPGGLRESDFAAGASRTDTTNPDDYSTVEDQYVAGKVEADFLTNSVLLLDLSYRLRDALSSNSGWDWTSDMTSMSLSPRLVIGETLGGRPNTLTLGYDYTHALNDISDGFYKLTKMNQGYYLNDELTVVDGLRLSAGFRHDSVDYRFAPSVPNETSMDENLYTLGASYDIQKETTVFASYARSFRYPVLDELYNYFWNTISTDLQGQTADNYELGLRHACDSGLTASLTLFLVDTDDEIFYNPYLWTNQNLDGTTRRQGVELAVAKEFERFTLRGSYTYTAAGIDGGGFDNKDVPGVAAHKATAGAVIRLPYNLTLGLDGVYVGERHFISDFNNDFDKMDDFLVVNANLTYRYQKFSIFAKVNNIFDTEYEEYGAIHWSGEPGYYPSPEANFLLGLKAEF